MTVSIGVAQSGDQHRSVEEVLKAADKALYGAKSAGRNRISSQVQRRRGAVKLKADPG